MTCNVYTFVPFSFELFFVFYNTCFVFVCGSVVICIDSARLGRKKILDDHSVMTMRTEERMQPIVYCSSIFHLESKNCLSFFFSFFFFYFIFLDVRLSLIDEHENTGTWGLRRIKSIRLIYKKKRCSTWKKRDFFMTVKTRCWILLEGERFISLFPLTRIEKRVSDWFVVPLSRRNFFSK